MPIITNISAAATVLLTLILTTCCVSAGDCPVPNRLNASNYSKMKAACANTDDICDKCLKVMLKQTMGSLKKKELRQALSTMYAQDTETWNEDALKDCAAQNMEVLEKVFSPVSRVQELSKCDPNAYAKLQKQLKRMLKKRGLDDLIDNIPQGGGATFIG